MHDAGAHGAVAEKFELRPLDALAIRGDDEVRDALVLIAGGVGARGDKNVGGDGHPRGEILRTRDAEEVALPARAGDDGRRIGARIGLGEAEGEIGVAPHRCGDERFFLRLGAALEHRLDAVADVAEDHGGQIEVVHPRRLEDDGKVHLVPAHAAEFLRGVDADPAVFRQRAVGFDRGLPFLVAFHGVIGRTHAPEQLVEGALHQLLLIAEIEIHGISVRYFRASRPVGGFGDYSPTGGPCASLPGDNDDFQNERNKAPPACRDTAPLAPYRPHDSLPKLDFWPEAPPPANRDFSAGGK